MTEAQPSPDDDDPLNWAVCNPLAGCGKRKKIEKFRLGGNICLACEKREREQKNEIAEVQAANKASIQEMGRRLIEQSRRTDLNLPALSAYMSALIDRFGGLESLVAAHHGEIVNAMTEHPGSAGTLKAFHQVMVGIGEANKQEVIRDIPNLDDAELVALVGQLAHREQQNIVQSRAKRIEQEQPEE